ncbi:MAG: rod-binding protein [Deltaproteobacteria bacterium]|nr:rod-binding protein [Deltaproteobacteria bacterium]
MTNQVSVPNIPWQTMYLTNKITGTKDSLKSSALPSSGKNKAGLKESCTEMESLFIYYLIKEMRSTIPKSGFMSGGMAEEVYTSMFDVQLAKELSLKDELGLSSMLFKSIEKENEHKGNEKEQNSQVTVS